MCQARAQDGIGLAFSVSMFLLPFLSFAWHVDSFAPLMDLGRLLEAVPHPYSTDRLRHQGPRVTTIGSISWQHGHSTSWVN